MQTLRLHLLIGSPIVTSAVSPPVTILTTIQHLAGTTKNRISAFLLSVMRVFLAWTVLIGVNPNRTRSLMEHRLQKSVFLRRRNRKSTFIKAVCNRSPKERELWTHHSSSRRSPAGGRQRVTLDHTGLPLCVCSFNHVSFKHRITQGRFFIDIHFARILFIDGRGQIALVY